MNSLNSSPNASRNASNPSINFASNDTHAISENCRARCEQNRCGSEENRTQCEENQRISEENRRSSDVNRTQSGENQCSSEETRETRTQGEETRNQCEENQRISEETRTRGEGNRRISGETRSCPVPRYRSETVLTFVNILDFISLNAATLVSLDLSLTLIDNESLSQLATVEGLRLRELRLVSCDQVSNEGFVQLFRHQPDLLRLDLSSCSRLTDLSVLALVSSCTRLQSLRIRNCAGLTDVSTRDLNRVLSSLQHVDISHCNQITGAGLAQMFASPAPHLHSLILSGLNLTPALFLPLPSQCTQIRVLDLSFCFTTVTDETLGAVFRHCPCLTELSLVLCDAVTDFGLMGLNRNASDNGSYFSSSSLENQVGSSDSNLSDKLRTIASERYCRDEINYTYREPSVASTRSRSGSFGGSRRGSKNDEFTRGETFGVKRNISKNENARSKAFVSQPSSGKVEFGRSRTFGKARAGSGIIGNAQNEGECLRNFGKGNDDLPVEEIFMPQKSSSRPWKMPRNGHQSQETSSKERLHPKALSHLKKSPSKELHHFNKSPSRELHHFNKSPSKELPCWNGLPYKELLRSKKSPPELANRKAHQTVFQPDSTRKLPRTQPPANRGEAASDGDQEELEPNAGSGKCVETAPSSKWGSRSRIDSSKSNDNMGPWKSNVKMGPTKWSSQTEVSFDGSVATRSVRSSSSHRRETVEWISALSETFEEMNSRTALQNRHNRTSLTLPHERNAQRNCPEKRLNQANLSRKQGLNQANSSRKQGHSQRHPQTCREGKSSQREGRLPNRSPQKPTSHKQGSHNEGRPRKSPTQGSPPQGRPEKPSPRPHKQAAQGHPQKSSKGALEKGSAEPFNVGSHRGHPSNTQVTPQKRMPGPCDQDSSVSFQQQLGCHSSMSFSTDITEDLNDEDNEGQSKDGGSSGQLGSWRTPFGHLGSSKVNSDNHVNNNGEGSVEGFLDFGGKLQTDRSIQDKGACSRPSQDVREVKPSRLPKPLPKSASYAPKEPNPAGLPNNASFPASYGNTHRAPKVPKHLRGNGARRRSKDGVPEMGGYEPRGAGEAGALHGREDPSNWGTLGHGKSAQGLREDSALGDSSKRQPPKASKSEDRLGHLSHLKGSNHKLFKGNTATTQFLTVKFDSKLLRSSNGLCPDIDINKLDIDLDKLVSNSSCSSMSTSVSTMHSLESVSDISLGCATKEVKNPFLKKKLSTEHLLERLNRRQYGLLKTTNPTYRAVNASYDVIIDRIESQPVSCALRWFVFKAALVPESRGANIVPFPRLFYKRNVLDVALMGKVVHMNPSLNRVRTDDSLSIQLIHWVLTLNPSLELSLVPQPICSSILNQVNFLLLSFLPRFMFSVSKTGALPLNGSPKSTATLFCPVPLCLLFTVLNENMNALAMTCSGKQGVFGFNSMKKCIKFIVNKMAADKTSKTHIIQNTFPIERNPQTENFRQNEQRYSQTDHISQNESSNFGHPRTERSFAENRYPDGARNSQNDIRRQNYQSNSWNFPNDSTCFRSKTSKCWNSRMDDNCGQKQSNHWNSREPSIDLSKVTNRASQPRFKGTPTNGFSEFYRTSQPRFKDSTNCFSDSNWTSQERNVDSSSVSTESATAFTDAYEPFAILIVQLSKDPNPKDVFTNAKSNEFIRFVPNPYEVDVKHVLLYERGVFQRIVEGLGRANQAGEEVDCEGEDSGATSRKGPHKAWHSEFPRKSERAFEKGTETQASPKGSLKGRLGFASKVDHGEGSSRTVGYVRASSLGTQLKKGIPTSGRQLETSYVNSKAVRRRGLFCHLLVVVMLMALVAGLVYWGYVLPLMEDMRAQEEELKDRGWMREWFDWIVAQVVESDNQQLSPIKSASLTNNNSSAHQPSNNPFVTHSNSSSDYPNPAAPPASTVSPKHGGAGFKMALGSRAEQDILLDARRKSEAFNLMRNMVPDQYSTMCEEEGRVMYGLNRVKGLTKLNLYGCTKITDVSLIYAFPHVPFLQHVDLSEIQEISSEGIRALCENNYRIQRLKLHCCFNLQDEDIDCITSRLKTLQSLDIANCVLLTDDCIRAVIRHEPPLKYLNLQRCGKISLAAINTLAAALPSLHTIISSSGGLVDEEPPPIPPPPPLSRMGAMRR
ncbi:hypothetical protein M8J75_015763 [Diaphorina citri]|nr:hypothetical protein M8J75_015763 [Diaphorina citri]